MYITNRIVNHRNDLSFYKRFYLVPQILFMRRTCRNMKNLEVLCFRVPSTFTRKNSKCFSLSPLEASGPGLLGSGHPDLKQYNA